jgi:UDP-glucose/galactose:(glucosyl)LPS alpha-1,2-glucosyl/galactosyltransferase
MHIAFVIDLPAFEGLGAALTSLVRNCSDTAQLDLHFICYNVRTRHKNNILMLLQTEGYHGRTKFYDFDALQLFGHLNAVQGSRTGYGRFLIPKLIDAEYVVCLDTDLLVMLDILTLDKIRFDNHFLGAVPAGPFRSIQDGKLLPGQLSVCRDGRCFNTGLLLLNLYVWKKRDICHEIEKICLRHPAELYEADHTVLNDICNGSFHYVEDRFNTIWSPDVEPAYTENSIFQFAGTLKPWDFLGKEIHAGYKLWTSYDTTFWDRRYKRIALSGLQRIWKIRKSLVKYYLKMRSLKTADALQVKRI